MPHNTLYSAFEHSTDFLNNIITKWDFSKIPLIVSISGPQGSGKTYVSTKIIQYISREYPQLKSIAVSTDDLYLKHSDQVKLSKEDNVLLKGRGLPGTHDIESFYNILQKLINRDNNFEIPTYDKSKFQGEGDRADRENWIHIGEKPVDIIIVEGWFNGFTPLVNDDEIDLKVQASKILQDYNKQDLYEINSNLDLYQKIWELFDYSIFFNVDDLEWIKDWRIEQEHALIKIKGSGMSDDQVVDFIKRYLAVYELYYKDFTEIGLANYRKISNLKLKGLKRNLKLTLYKDRSVKQVEEI
ncbi:hypothetical protein WICMUC_004812 [Wickerhamomyces mucosus]|uniref:Phosphoribulokinase/uridine kinase domain-containing protein n=1 Tax=Wickerhamomyces mucosus TaxID=1378264 RepID=A0A9P8PEK6_9ASCO|nr:hypothetical protein WICMUC_004812 [Wickerhamomyces mucosus]